MATMTTRPPSNDPADVAAWEEEKERIRDGDRFREEVRTFMGEQRVSLAEMRADLQQHIQDDADQFVRLWRAVRRIGRRAAQTATTYRMDRGVLVAWASALLGICGILWAVYVQVIK